MQFSNVLGDKLASICKDGSLCIWEVKWQNVQGLQSVQVRCLHAIQTKNTLTQLNWSNTTDDWFVTSGKDKYATVWSAKTGRQVIKLDGHSSSIQAAIFSHDDRKVFTIGIDQNLVIWEVDMDK